MASTAGAAAAELGVYCISMVTDLSKCLGLVVLVNVAACPCNSDELLDWRCRGPAVDIDAACSRRQRQPTARCAARAPQICCLFACVCAAGDSEFKSSESDGA